MLKDIVIDTNVFMHASDIREALQESAISFLSSLLKSDTALCLDHGFCEEEAQNRSSILSEYWRFLVPQTFASNVLAHLLATSRVVGVSKSCQERDRKVICQNVRDRSDRIFLFVTINSDEKILVSHDYGDISQRARGLFSRYSQLKIIDSSSATKLF